jgi:hypothetical protein
MGMAAAAVVVGAVGAAFPRGAVRHAFLILGVALVLLAGRSERFLPPWGLAGLGEGPVATCGLLLLLGALGSAARCGRSRAVLAVALVGAAFHFSMADLERAAAGLGSRSGYRGAAGCWTAVLVTLQVWIAGRIAGHLSHHERPGRPRGAASASLAAWAQVRPWHATGAVALATTACFLTVLLDAQARVIRPVYLEIHSSALRKEAVAIAFAWCVVLLSTAPHLTAGCKSAFARCVPLYVMVVTALCLTGTAASVARRITTEEWIAFSLGSLLVSAWAAGSAYLPSVTTRWLRPGLNLLLPALLGCAWWARWAETHGARDSFGAYSTTTAVLIPVVFHRLAVSARPPRAGVFALVAVSIFVAAAHTADPAWVWAVWWEIWPEEVLGGLLSLLALTVFGAPLVVVARRARSVCAVPPDHPIVTDYGGGHPATPHDD